MAVDGGGWRWMPAGGGLCPPVPIGSHRRNSWVPIPRNLSAVNSPIHHPSITLSATSMLLQCYFNATSMLLNRLFDCQLLIDRRSQLKLVGNYLIISLISNWFYFNATSVLPQCYLSATKTMMDGNGGSLLLRQHHPIHRPFIDGIGATSTLPKRYPNAT